jgi:hypothetical protein
VWYTGNLNHAGEVSGKIVVRQKSRGKKAPRAEGSGTVIIHRLYDLASQTKSELSTFEDTNPMSKSQLYFFITTMSN